MNEMKEMIRYLKEYRQELLERVAAADKLLANLADPTAKNIFTAKNIKTKVDGRGHRKWTKAQKLAASKRARERWAKK